MVAKAKIDIKAGVIELEGTESFVAKYLDDFRKLVGSTAQKIPISAEPINTERQKPEQSTEKQKKEKKETTKKKIKRRYQRTFDYSQSDNRQSLNSFYTEKDPKNYGEGIAVIGYYLLQYHKAKTFNIKNLKNAFSAIEISAPKHIGQVMYNNRELGLYEKTDKRTFWKLTDTGIAFVEGLPKK